MKKLFYPLLFLLFSSIQMLSQTDLSKAKEINLYINCQASCDTDFIKTEITSVNYVHDRFEANLYLHIISEATDSGEKINLFFEGQKELIGLNDTLTYFNLATETFDETRQKMVNNLKIMLVRYLAYTPYLSSLKINLPSKEVIVQKDSIDKWRNWIFDVGISGNFSKNDYQSSHNLRGSFKASKVTDLLKVSTSNSYSASESKWEYDGNETIVNKNSANSSNNIVFSLGPHFSAGSILSLGYSQYNNYKFYLNVKPAIEYNIFPYKESVKKTLTIQYGISPSFSKYFEKSYYGVENSEWVFKQSLSLNTNVTQKWGEIYLSAGWDTFLNPFYLDNVKIKGLDISNISISGYISLEIFKGVSIYMNSGLDFTQGVLPNIPEKEFSYEDLITNSRVYPTSKNYYFYGGINYRFGSKNSNVVNSRMSSSRTFYYFN